MSQNAHNDNTHLADGTLLENAQRALREVYGPSEGWSKETRYIARRFVEAVGRLSPDNLSLAALKDALDDSTCRDHLHRVAVRFLLLSADLYTATDRDAMLSLIPELASMDKPHRIVFGNGVLSFDDLSYYRYCGRTTFVVVNTKNETMKPVYREFIRHSSWSSYDKPNQERFDRLFRLLDTYIPRRERLAPLSVRTFFRIADALARKQEARTLSAGDRKDTLHDLILLYRYCLKNRPGVRGDAPVTDPAIFRSQGTVTFFFEDYISRETTFLFRPRGKDRTARLETITIDNLTVRNTYGQLLLSGTVSPEEYAACRFTLEESLGRDYDTIRCLEDWKEPMLHRQVAFYRKLYEGQKKRTYALSLVKSLYLSIDRQTNGAFFRKCFSLTYGLLTSRRFVIYCDMGFSFIPYSDFEPITEGNRIVFIVNGFNRMAKRYRAEDYIAVDLTTITDHDYRSLAWRAVTSKAGRLYRRSFAYTLRHLLRFLPALKSRQGWLSPDRKAFTFYDALAVLAFFFQKTNKVTAFNSNMMNVRDFLRWARDAGALEVEPTAFDILSNMKYAHHPTNTAIVSDEHLVAVSSYLADKAKKDSNYGQALLILHMLLVTPIRITSVCSLLHEEIVHDESIHSTVIVASSKGTHGNTGRIVMGEPAARIIAKAQALGEKIGLGCTSETLRNNIFLYQSKGKYYVWTPRRFGDFMNEACRELGIPSFTAKNLRANYMTAAYIAASEGGETNDFVLKLYSYHKRAGTTLEHYVNHDEAFSTLRDSMNRGDEWKRTLVPDEIKAIRAAIAETESILEDENLPGTARTLLTGKLEEYRRKLDDLKS